MWSESKSKLVHTMLALLCLKEYHLCPFLPHKIPPMSRFTSSVCEKKLHACDFFKPCEDYYNCN